MHQTPGFVWFRLRPAERPKSNFGQLVLEARRGNTGFKMSFKSDEDILRDDPDLAEMFTDDEDDVIDNDDDDFGDDFKGFNFARSGSQKHKKTE